MSSEIKVSNVKAKDGTAGISIADSTGRVTFTETNPTITLGSNTTFPTKVTDKTYFFPVDRSGVSSSSYGFYRTAGLTSSNPTRTTALVPSQTTTVVGASFCWIPATNDTFADTSRE